MLNSFRLGNILGIPIGIHYSWFLCLLLLTSSIAYSIGQIRPSWSPLELFGVAIVSSLLLFASVVAHELCHSLVARRHGIPVRGITLFVLGGVAHITRESTRPAAEFAIAIVGPASSIVIGLGFLALSYIVEPVSIHLTVIARWLFVMNIALALFNLIPGFPLDGGRAFRAGVWAVSGNHSLATRIATIGGRITAAAFVVAGVAFLLMWEAYLLGIWLAFTGWFLWLAASMSARRARQLQRLKGYVARDLMSADCPEISPETALRDVGRRKAIEKGGKCYIVIREHRVEGLLGPRSARRLGKGSWESANVSQAMVPLDLMPAVAPDDDSYRVLELLDEGDTGIVTVVESGELLGVIVQDSLIGRR